MLTRYIIIVCIGLAITLKIDIIFVNIFQGSWYFRLGCYDIQIKPDVFAK